MRHLGDNLAATGVVILAVVFVLWSIRPLSSPPKAQHASSLQEIVRQHARITTESQRLQHVPEAAQRGTLRPQIAVAPKGSPAVEQSSSSSSYAYAFYATSDEYACGVLVNIYRLRNILNSSLPIHVLTSSDVSSSYIAAFQDRNATVHIEVPPPIADASGGFYRDCLLKLLAFKLHRLSPGLKRVLAFDSDQLIMRNLDHLFSGLPEVDLAAPRAYWLAKDFLASTFLLISLSDRLWDTVNKALDAVGFNKFDMDIINDLLGDAVMMLSGEYVTLNSHWEDWNLPNWYHPTSSFNMTTVELLNKLATQQEDRSNANRNKGRDIENVDVVSDVSGLHHAPGDPVLLEHAEATRKSILDIGPLAQVGDTKNPYALLPSARPDSLVATPPSEELEQPPPAQQPPPSLNPPTIPAPAPRFPVGHPIFQELIHLQDAAAVIHFSALGKPWSIAPETVSRGRPDAHPLFGSQFQLWRQTAIEVCPSMALAAGAR